MSQNNLHQSPESQYRPGPQFHEQPQPGQQYQSPQPGQQYQPPQPEKKKNWFARHKTLTIIGAIVILIIIFAAISGGGDDDEPVADNAAPAVEEAAAEDPAAAPAEEPVEEPAEEAAVIGDAVVTGDLEFTITGTEPGGTSLGNEYLSADAQGEFFLVHVSVTNVGSEAVYFTGSNQKLVDDQGREHEADGTASLYIPDNDTLFTDVNPGNTVNGTLVFDLPADAVPTTILVSDSMFGEGVTVSLAQ